ncbi:sigma-70 family RNA polymerase sigma factor [Methylotenera sp.]|uniref:sigma-70 family RNA polymerase sigma factor n=1 Tax=Methylotenera sp. TaxID=2051956 RepID=UPI0024887794|nr:sigma-70 family RNA polymerase sigma factor [Methylotenera sp.]MDI1298760.1 sigma-70 family RNA polymerase sigma factor [Methylotenera sp.]
MSDTLVSDDILMRKFCSGDGKAFRTLYTRHEKPLYRYLRRVLGIGLVAQVDEVFQDTWMRMVDARDSWQPRDGVAFKTWLYTLAHHRAVDILRKSGREVSADESWLDEDSETAWQLWPASSAEQPEQQAFWRKAGQQLLHCLEGLPALQRAAFLLHHEDGLSLDEITQVLNTEFETVKSRLRYALYKLRLCMGAHLQPILEADTTS